MLRKPTILQHWFFLDAGENHGASQKRTIRPPHDVAWPSSHGRNGCRRILECLYMLCCVVFAFFIIPNVHEQAIQGLADKERSQGGSAATKDGP